MIDILIYLMFAIFFIAKLFFALGADEDDGADVGFKMANRLKNVKVQEMKSEDFECKYSPKDRMEVATLALKIAKDSNLDSLQKIENDPYNIKLIDVLCGLIKAFEILFVAYTRSDSKMIQTLTDENTFAALRQKAFEKERMGQIICSKLLGIDSVILKYIRCNDSDAWLCAEIHSDQVVCIRNKEGEVVKGEPNKIVRVVDVIELHHDFTSAGKSQSEWKFCRI